MQVVVLCRPKTLVIALYRLDGLSPKHQTAVWERISEPRKGGSNLVWIFWKQASSDFDAIFIDDGNAGANIGNLRMLLKVGNLRLNAERLGYIIAILARDIFSATIL